VPIWHLSITTFNFQRSAPFTFILSQNLNI
jgi:hypothetical protein